MEKFTYCFKLNISRILFIATASEEPFPNGILKSPEIIKSNGSDIRKAKDPETRRKRHYMSQVKNKLVSHGCKESSNLT